MDFEYIHDFGWIAPDGTYYKCDSWGHAKFAEEVLHKEELDLENQGWIRVTPSPPNGRGVFSKSMYITQQQYETLMKHGFDEADLEEDCIFVME